MVSQGFSGIYSGKRVLVTGHTGFKGGWLSLWLHLLGAKVSGFSLPAAGGLNLFEIIQGTAFARSMTGDLRDAGVIRAAIGESQPEIIFHLAAQPIVSVSYRDPVGTFTTNALGTIMLLEAVRQLESPAAVVIVTSDKCYRNDNSGRPFVEDDPLGGEDVYSMSKAVTELVAGAWHASFFSKNAALGRLATARAGNVIGGGDYAEDRIVPDAVRAFDSGIPLVLRRPQATRPWQHVLESASGYLAVGQRLLSQSEKTTLLNFNFGPHVDAGRSVRELVDAWLAEWPDSVKPINASQSSPAEAQRLSLDHTRAMTELGWKPAWDFTQAVQQTARWYRRRHEARDPNDAMLDLTRAQITDYTQAATLAGAAWAV